MTSRNTEQNQGEITILHNLLRIIATTPAPGQCVQPILELGQSLTTGVSGLAFILFNEPQLIETFEIKPADIPNIERLAFATNRIEDWVQLNPEIPDVSLNYPAWMIAPIRVQRTTIGLVWLVFDSPVTGDLPYLESLVDALTIVATNIRTQARHDKIVRNQSEFIRIVSHDLRSPLTSIQGFGSMLESGMVGTLNEKQQSFVEKILSGVAQMTSLVDNIQDAGRYDPENGFYEMDRSQCDVVGIVDKVMKNHLVPADKQEMKINSRIESENIPIINADVHMLERALTNLVDNAIKYTPNGGEVMVGVTRKGDDIIISVKDNGLGISPENQKLLFERHRRIPREEHKRIKGSGLGLFIVRSAARRHGGDAWVESSEGKGSTFFISIPVNGQNALIS